ncbi:MAG TPA: ABC transporter ATP-binding protein [Spirochaetota bacterium]|nr:ABC transporter ATP-binding protein [Spirochaetota bacterium]
MFKLLKLILKEKLLLVICVFCILMTASFFLSQILVYSGFNKIFINTEQPEIEKQELVIDEVVLQDKSYFEQMKTIYDVYKRGGQKQVLLLLQKQKNLSVLVLFCAFAFLVYLSYQFFNFLRTYTADLLALKITTKIRKNFFRHIVHLPSYFFKNNLSGEVISKTLNDVNMLRQYTIKIFATFLYAPLIITVALIIMLHINYRFTLILFAMALFAVLILSLLKNILKKAVSRFLAKLDRMTEYLQKVFFGIDIVKIFNRQKYETDKFDVVVNDYLHAAKTARKIVRLNKPLIELVGFIAVIIILMFGISLVWEGNMTNNQIFDFIIILVLVSPIIHTLTNVVLLKQHIDVAMGRLDHITSMPREKDSGGKKLSSFKGEVCFENVFYKYNKDDKEHVLNKVSFHVKPGQMVAFVGASGCGKTTLINLIPRIILPVKGNIYFDNENYLNFSLAWLRSNIAMVSQNSILFPGTMRENISYGDLSASEEEIYDAARQAAIHDFITKLPHGYDTQVGELGSKLSGGQRQRICIARSVLKKPRILLLDEATSALDSEAEKLVQQAIDGLISRQTTFVIAHRLSTIINADKIFVLEGGIIVEEGDHKTLLAKDGFYKRLYNLQYNS